MTDHDRLFKQLLSTFFLEFLDLFAPELAARIEAGSIEFLEKEHFTDALGGRHHVVDLLARVRVQSLPGYVLVHVENEASAKAAKDFPRRMFRYFAGLEGRHGRPVYPVAVLSYSRPRTPRSDRYEMVLPGLDVLRFRFRQVQLNLLPWREYMRHHNPVAVALMSRMQMAPDERWRVKFECLKLLVQLRLDRAKERLVSSFLDTYLRLQGDERRLFAEELDAMPGPQKEEVMELTTSWKEEGRAEGRRQEAMVLVLRLLKRRFGPPPAAASDALERLPLRQLEQLSEDLLDFTSLDDLDRWLNDNH